MFYSILLIIYCLYISIDFGVLTSVVNTSYFKYAGIIICAFYVYCLTKQKIFHFIMACLCIADYILLFTDYYSLGIFVFCIIQCTYMYLLKKDNHIFYYVLGYVSITLLVLWPIISLLYSIAFIYASFSLYNGWYAWYRKEYDIAITLLLLSICDIFVACSYYFPSFSIFIWIFYLPSQLFFIKYCKRQELINEK